MKSLFLIYNKLPIWIKNIGIAVYGCFLSIKRYGGEYRKSYKCEKKNASLTLDELQSIQLRKLKDTLQESVQYCDYYKRVFAEAGITSDTIEKADDAQTLLQKIPILEKDILRKNMDSIVSKNVKRKKYAVTYTSGSTGSPMAVVQDKEATQYSFSVLRRFYDWIGLPRSFKSVRLSGRIVVEPDRNKPPFWVHNVSNRQLFMSTYHLTEANLKYYIKKLDSYKPEFINGFPSAIRIIAEYIVRNNIELKFKPIAIATTAETLTENMKAVIEKAFRCRVYDQYASSEGAPFACQCKAGNMHLWIDTGFFEFVNREEFSEELDRAEILVTSFRSKKTPLIRYEIGDGVLLYKDDRRCSCGCQYPIINSVVGRMDDILYTEEKGYVGRLDTAYKGVKGITESQIIQKNSGSIYVYVVKNESYDKKQELLLRGNLEDRLGTKIDIQIIYVEAISRGENGKFRTVIREFEVK